MNRIALPLLRPGVVAVALLLLTLPVLAAPDSQAPHHNGKGKKADAATTNGAPANPFADIVRKTEALTPEEELKTFHLPPGFRIELVASEPQISKPINMAFDNRGRLWISQSREYPFPAPTNRTPHDAIMILSDFDRNGHANSITTFATNLNIPIGLYPFKDGALAYSIPMISDYHDTNHDGHADYKEPLLGRFGFEKDTHGMTSSFRRGYDGWLYANHGFHNDSVLTAKDGSSIELHSGNTYRVRVDGSHIEQFAWGRVNPFGLIFDPLGDLYSSDCETLPIYQLLRGGYYPSFGKPDDGLGFAPPMMSHKHGSTAIAGIVYYSATNFPPEFRDNIFVGNVMTCRIDRDSLEPHGSTRIAVEQPDFLSTTDPWFRPVDMQTGPDGAIYVADFYNRIIGHYEVPLDHPGRDRERGRIWRISYVGTNAAPKSVPPPHLDLARASVNELIRELGDASLPIRTLATDELTDRIGVAAIKPLQRLMRSRRATVYQKIHAMWALFRLGGLDDQMLADAAHDPDSRLKVHAQRVYAEKTVLSPAEKNLVRVALQDEDALVRRCAADALGQHTEIDNLRPLLDLRASVPADDTHLLYVVRMALRNQLRDPRIFAALPLPNWSAADDAAIADVALAVPSSESAAFLLQHLEHHPESRAVTASELRHVARYASEAQLDALMAFTTKQFGDDLDFQLALFESVQEGTAQRGVKLSDTVKAAGTQIALALVTNLDTASGTWFNTPVAGQIKTDNPWSLQKRTSADGDTTGDFLSTQPNEPLTGILRSRTFAAPSHLSFYLAGHNGSPVIPDLKKNVVRLIDAETHSVLKETFPPRSDIAQKTDWDLTAIAGRNVYLELTDADSGGAYAWLAFGRLEPLVVSLPRVNPRSLGQRQHSVAVLAKSLEIAALQPNLQSWLADKHTDTEARAASAEALLTLTPSETIPKVSAIARDPSESQTLRESMAHALATVNSAAARNALVDALRAAPDRLQVKMALALASTPEGAEMLLRLAEQGKVSPRLMNERSIQERFTAVQPKDYVARVAVLTKNLPPANAAIDKIIEDRRAHYDPTVTDVSLGAKVFSQNCMICHSLDNKGGAVGPHLDGVGNRGLDRLMEDVLDPSRNVDPSFRYSTVTLKDGDIYAGLQRREEGATIVFVDASGKETAIPKANIEKKVESSSSLMPDNFSEAIPPKDFNNLMAFLLSKGSGIQTR